LTLNRRDIEYWKSRSRGESDDVPNFNERSTRNSFENLALQDSIFMIFDIIFVHIVLFIIKPLLYNKMYT